MSAEPIIRRRHRPAPRPSEPPATDQNIPDKPEDAIQESPVAEPIACAQTKLTPPSEVCPPAALPAPSSPNSKQAAVELGADTEPASAERTGGKEYNIGWKKPPKEHQFKPGNNANPKGRPKGSKNLATILKEKLDKKLRVNWQGKLRNMSVGEVGLTRLVNKFAETGDPRLFLAIAKILPASSPQSDNDAPLDPGEQASNEAILKFVQAMLRDGGSLLPPASEPQNNVPIEDDDDREGEAA